MASILAHPFRLGPAGSMATVDEGTAVYVDQQVAAVILTHRGERPMVPAFGITDPTFTGVDLAQVRECLQRFYGDDDFEVTNVEAEAVGPTESVVTVTWKDR